MGGGIVGLIIGGFLGWSLVAETAGRNLPASFEWAGGWGQVLIVVAGLIVFGLILPRLAAAAATLIGLGAFVAFVMTFFTEQANFAPMMAAFVIGALGAIVLALRVQDTAQGRRAEERALQGVLSDGMFGPRTAAQGGKTARRSVHDELEPDERVLAEGAIVDLGLGGHPGWAAVTDARLVWAINADARIAMSMSWRGIVEHRKEGMLFTLTHRDPAYAASLSDPSNPHGETDAALQVNDQDVAAALQRALSGP